MVIVKCRWRLGYTGVFVLLRQSYTGKTRSYLKIENPLWYLQQVKMNTEIASQPFQKRKFLLFQGYGLRRRTSKITSHSYALRVRSPGKLPCVLASSVVCQRSDQNIIGGNIDL